MTKCGHGLAFGWRQGSRRTRLGKERTLRLALSERDDKRPASRPVSELKDVSLQDLLGLHAGVIEELRRRGVSRSANNSTGSLAEFLFCRAFFWQQASNSEKGFDASDGDGKRYQIKGRRLHRRNKSRQLSAIRDLDGFDVLARGSCSMTDTVCPAPL